MLHSRARCSCFSSLALTFQVSTRMSRILTSQPTVTLSRSPICGCMLNIVILPWWLCQSSSEHLSRKANQVTGVTSLHGDSCSHIWSVPNSIESTTYVHVFTLCRWYTQPDVSCNVSLGIIFGLSKRLRTQMRGRHDSLPNLSTYMLPTPDLKSSASTFLFKKRFQSNSDTLSCIIFRTSKFLAVIGKIFRTSRPLSPLMASCCFPKST